MNEQPPLLAARDLSVGYVGRSQPPRRVAEGLNVDLWAGQLVCLLGPNGAGKSTLMRTMAGLQPPLTGQITLVGQALPTISAVDLARRLSLVLAERVDASNLLVHELVALGRTPHTGWLGKLTLADREKVQAAMRMTDTLAFAQRRLHQLSDGERQKVMLARALAQDTDLILLDEPTAHLDLPNRVGMMRLLHQLTRQTGKAILLSTHELDLALQAADKLWLLAPGGHLAMGTPEDLVLTGAFAATFDKAGFHFDRATGTFTLHAFTNGPTVRLTGDDTLLFWTRRALSREGFTLTSAPDATCLIDASYQHHNAIWMSYVNGTAQMFRSIDELLTSLQLVKTNQLVPDNSENDLR